MESGFEYRVKIIILIGVNLLIYSSIIGIVYQARKELDRQSQSRYERIQELDDLTREQGS